MKWWNLYGFVIFPYVRMRVRVCMHVKGVKIFIFRVYLQRWCERSQMPWSIESGMGSYISDCLSHDYFYVKSCHCYWLFWKTKDVLCSNAEELLNFRAILKVFTAISVKKIAFSYKKIVFHTDKRSKMINFCLKKW